MRAARRWGRLLWSSDSLDSSLTRSDTRVRARRSSRPLGDRLCEKTRCAVSRPHFVCGNIFGQTPNQPPPPAQSSAPSRSEELFSVLASLLMTHNIKGSLFFVELKINTFQVLVGSRTSVQRGRLWEASRRLSASRAFRNLSSLVSEHQRLWGTKSCLMETGNDSDKESLLMRGAELTREKNCFISSSYYSNIMETKVELLFFT